MTRYLRQAVCTVIAVTMVGSTGCSSGSKEPPRDASIEQQSPAQKWEGKLVKMPGTSTLEENKVYVVQGGKKRWIQNPKWVTQNGYRFQDLQVITAAELAAIPTGDPIQ